MTTKELKSHIDRILGNSVRLLLPSYWWKRVFGMTLDKVDADKAELTRTIQSVDNKVKKVIAYIPLEGATLTQAQKDTNSKRFDGNKDFNCLVFVYADGKTSVEGAGSQIIYVSGSHIQYIDGTNVIEATVSTSGEVKTKVVQTFGGLQYALERTVYVTKTKMGNNINDTEITEEQRAYNIETNRLACIENKAILINFEGLIFTTVFKDGSGNYVLSANIGNLLSYSLIINKNGDAEIEISNAVDTKLDLDSINPVQNKVVTAALTESLDIATKSAKGMNIYIAVGQTTLSDEQKTTNASTFSSLVSGIVKPINCVLVAGTTKAQVQLYCWNGGSERITLYTSDWDNGDAFEKLKYRFFPDGSTEYVGRVTVDSELSPTSERPIQNKAVAEALNAKADKVDGKQLSTEDFTSALKTKLEGLSNYDDTQIAKRIQEVEADIPTKVSQLENDRGYLTEHQDISNLASKNDLAKKQDVISDLATIRSGASKGATALQSIPSEYVTESELNDKGYATTAQVNAKVDKTYVDEAIASAIELAITNVLNTEV